MTKNPEEACSIARTLGVVGERWTFLILREAFLGATRFAEFRDRLGVAPDILSDRLATLVEYGVMAREPYREPGARSRFAYRLTPAGRELQVVLSALQQWGDEHLPRPEGPSMLRRVRGTDGPVHVGYLDDEGRESPPRRRRHHPGQLARRTKPLHNRRINVKEMVSTEDPHTPGGTVSSAQAEYSRLNGGDPATALLHAKHDAAVTRTQACSRR